MRTHQTYVKARHVRTSTIKPVVLPATFPTVTDLRQITLQKILSNHFHFQGRVHTRWIVVRQQRFEQLFHFFKTVYDELNIIRSITTHCIIATHDGRSWAHSSEQDPQRNKKLASFLRTAIDGPIEDKVGIVRESVHWLLNEDVLRCRSKWSLLTLTEDFQLSKQRLKVEPVPSSECNGYSSFGREQISQIQGEWAWKWKKRQNPSFQHDFFVILTWKMGGKKCKSRFFWCDVLLGSGPAFSWVCGESETTKRTCFSCETDCLGRSDLMWLTIDCDRKTATDFRRSHAQPPAQYLCDTSTPKTNSIISFFIDYISHILFR